MNRFYIDSQIKGDRYILRDKEQAKQMKKVLRLAQGDRVLLFDDTGFEFDAQINEIDIKQVSFKILKKSEGIGFTKDITIYVALLKKDNFEVVLQKAVELGVKTIVPVLTQRCVKDKISISQYERFRKIIKEATEQSEGSLLPELKELVDFNIAIDSLSENDLNLIAYERNGEHTLKGLNLDNKINIFIGPEGGFTDQEIDYALNNNLISITLGERILRAETAVIAVLGRLIID